MQKENYINKKTILLLLVQTYKMKAIWQSKEFWSSIIIIIVMKSNSQIAMTMTNWRIFAKWMWVNFQKEINRFSCTHFAHLVSICQTLCNTRNAKASPSKGICLSVSRQVSQTTREQINYPTYLVVSMHILDISWSI